MIAHVPAGYRRLPPGKSCDLCLRLYQTLNGEFWCCTDITASNTSCVAPEIDAKPILAALSGPMGRVMFNNEEGAR